MIFSDQTTAKEVRNKADIELKRFITDMILHIKGHSSTLDFNEEIIEDYVDSAVRNELPPLVGTLLYRSGMIHSNNNGPDETPHYPVVLYYDNDSEKEGDYRITQAMLNAPYRLSGGMVNGHIHT